MKLYLDCGNTRLKWGLHDGQTWRANGALMHADIPQLTAQFPDGCVPDSALGCNVAGDDCAQQIEYVLRRPVHWISAQAEQCGVINNYEDPATLGADRWAALVGARSIHQGPALVVLAGTATTIDAMDAAGQFLGGLIVPGVAMMADALAQGTARLPSTLPTDDFRRLPRNTRDAIASGALHATLGAIERMARTFPDNDAVLCLLSGGAAQHLQTHLSLANRWTEHLVLDGLISITAAIGLHPA